MESFGAHLIIRAALSARIEGVEFVRGGQKGVLGRYALPSSVVARHNPCVVLACVGMCVRVLMLLVAFTVYSDILFTFIYWGIRLAKANICETPLYPLASRDVLLFMTVTEY